MWPGYVRDETTLQPTLYLNKSVPSAPSTPPRSLLPPPLCFSGTRLIRPTPSIPFNAALTTPHPRSSLMGRGAIDHSRHPPCLSMPLHASPRLSTPHHASPCPCKPHHASPCLPCHAMPFHHSTHASRMVLEFTIAAFFPPLPFSPHLLSALVLSPLSSPPCPARIHHRLTHGIPSLPPSMHACGRLPKAFNPEAQIIIVDAMLATGEWALSHRTPTHASTRTGARMGTHACLAHMPV
ncbi:unnamed protein product [Closterium sp. NIES-54]